MCGILGYVTDHPSDKNYLMLRDLLYVSAARGTDATGIAVVGKKTEIIKDGIPSDKFIKKYYLGAKESISKSKIVLGHTRLATQGHQRDNNNNHPILSRKYIMVHNGTCSTMDKIKDYPYKGTVDSEILLSYVEKKGFKDGLKELKGSAAVAIICEDEPDAVYLWRHSNPLWVAYDPNAKVIFFASTEDILEEGLANLLNFFSSFQMREIAENILYKVTCSPLNIEAIAKIEPKSSWGGYQYTYPYTYKRYASCAMGEGEGFYDLLSDEENEESTSLNSDTPPYSQEQIKDNPPKMTKIYNGLLNCKWDSKNKMFTSDKIDVGEKTNRYYFDNQSRDFEHWSRLEGGGHVSIDKKLAKFFDRDKKAHFITTIVDAVRDGLIDLRT